MSERGLLWDYSEDVLSRGPITCYLEDNAMKPGYFTTMKAKISTGNNGAFYEHVCLFTFEGWLCI
jgi:hypothetical protein